jgi:hypothetical protein
MATYKVLQDIEAEDKLVGPLTLRQFIYAAIAAFMLYLSFFSLTKHVGFLMFFFMPVALFTGFLAIPWHGDQPTEVWAVARLRFLLKPRKRIWDQSGGKDLVTITVPKRLERNLTNGLSETEVTNRLRALASTIDSRGWAVKNVNLNMSPLSGLGYGESDRLIEGSTLPQQVSNIDVQAADDILDTSANPVAQHFDSMITNAAVTHRQQLISQLQQPSIPAQTQQTATPALPNDYWFMHQATPVAGQTIFDTSTVIAPGTATVNEPTFVPQAATPTEDEEALVAQLKAANSDQSIASDHMKHIKTTEELAEDAQKAAAEQAEIAAEQVIKAQVTSDKQAVIMNLARNDDFDVATLARQARKDTHSDDGEVVISLR